MERAVHKQLIQMVNIIMPNKAGGPNCDKMTRI